MAFFVCARVRWGGVQGEMAIISPRFCVCACVHVCGGRCGAEMRFSAGGVAYYKSSRSGRLPTLIYHVCPLQSLTRCDRESNGRVHA